ncbi:MAG: PIN domain-containing protein [Treponema sp.]|nr:PIN domain-containing protein [Treponema sp.]
MRVLLDTNVILDVLLEREVFEEESSKLLSMIERGIIKGFVSSVSVTDIYYISHQTFHDKEKALNVINELLFITRVLKTDEKIIKNAIKLKWKDFEDAVQYSVAKKSHIDFIITRNKKDYKTSNIPVYTPKEFLEKINDSFFLRFGKSVTQ